MTTSGGRAARAWTKYTAAARLQRDAEITATFIVAHGMRERPTRSGAELQAAEDYLRWCLTGGRTELNSLDGTEIAPFINEWRLRAVAADVRAASIAAELRLVAALACMFVALMSGWAHAWLVLSLAALTGAGLAFSLRYVRSELVVGPGAPVELPPLVAGTSLLGRSYQGLAFRLANFGCRA